MRRQQALFNVNFPLLVTVVALLPLLGALTCIVLSILLNFKESTWTHCRVSIIGESYAVSQETRISSCHFGLSKD